MGGGASAEDLDIIGTLPSGTTGVYYPQLSTFSTSPQNMRVELSEYPEEEDWDDYDNYYEDEDYDWSDLDYNDSIVIEVTFPDGIINETYEAGPVIVEGTVGQWGLQIIGDEISWLKFADSETPILRGTPTKAGTYEFSLIAYDESGSYAQKDFTLTIKDSKDSSPSNQPKESGDVTPVTPPASTESGDKDGTTTSKTEHDVNVNGSAGCNSGFACLWQVALMFMLAAMVSKRLK